MFDCIGDAGDERFGLNDLTTPGLAVRAAACCLAACRGLLACPVLAVKSWPRPKPRLTLSCLCSLSFSPVAGSFWLNPPLPMDEQGNWVNPPAHPMELELDPPM